MTEPRHIAIVALRRSGTTTLWRLLRQDARYRCFDEPFSPKLAQLPAEHLKNVRAEFIELFNRDPEHFRAVFAPIPRNEETTREMSKAQKAYLSFLLSEGPTAFDVTRCMGKVPAIAEVAPGAVLVHLFRHPVAFASSHLLPSDRRDFLRLRDYFNRKTFFTRATNFNGWGMEELTRTDHVTTTNSLLAEVGLALPPAERKVPAVQRLLTIWLAAFRLAEREGPANYGDRFASLSFEEFCERPKERLGDILSRAGAGGFAPDTSAIRPARAGFNPGDERWRELAKKAGFDSSELGRFFPNEVR